MAIRVQIMAIRVQMMAIRARVMAIRVPMTSVRDQTCIMPGGGCMCIGPPIIPGGIGIGGLRCNVVHALWLQHGTGIG